MKTRRNLIALAPIFALFVILAAATYGQTTGFTFQGRLTDSSFPSNGTYSMQFELFATPTGGSAIATQSIPGVSVSNGIFTVQLDYGACPACFDGTDRYLEVTVNTITLSPRQKVSSSPYSIRSATSGNSLSLGGVTAANYLQSNGDGSQLTNLNASNIGGGTLADGRLSSNVALRNAANTFTADQTIIGNVAQNGTSTNLVLANGFVVRGTLFAGSIPASGQGARMMFYPGKAALRAGYAGANQWDDANIGTYSVALGDSTIASGVESTALGSVTTASGGYSLAAGRSTIASGDYSTALGGSNTASGFASTALGFSSVASGNSSTSLGNGNRAYGDYSTAIGVNAWAWSYGSTAMGWYTTALGNYSTSMGSYASTNGQQGSFVYGDNSTTNNVTSVGPNSFVVRASGGFRFRTASDLSTGCDIATGNLSCTGSISGSSHSGSGAGLTNLNASNIATGTIGDARLSANVALKNGSNNFTAGQTITGANFTINGGVFFQSGVSATMSLVNGFVAKGTYGATGGIPATGLGSRLMFYPSKAAFRAGYVDGTQWDDSNIGNTSIGVGFNTTANGPYSTAIGSYASTNGFAGSFVYGDNSATTDVTASSANEWTIRAAGGYRFFTDAGLTTGVSLSAGGGAWNTISDRNAKDNINPVNPREILKGVLGLPIATWNYKGQPQFRHIGAMAQDFYATFNVGESNKTITTVDPDGVALAAIQGLNEELKDRDTKIEQQQQQLNTVQEQLRQQQTMITELKRLVCSENRRSEICGGKK